MNSCQMLMAILTMFCGSGLVWGSICGCYGCNRPSCCTVCCAGSCIAFMSLPFTLFSGSIIGLVVGIKMLSAGVWFITIYGCTVKLPSQPMFIILWTFFTNHREKSINRACLKFIVSVHSLFIMHTLWFKRIANGIRWLCLGAYFMSYYYTIILK